MGELIERDCISKQKLIEEIQYYIKEANWGEEVNKVLGWCIEWIERQPSVKPTKKTGRWIDNSPNAYECSECQIIRAKGTTGKYNFCPNCGARMESEQK